jgi:chemotaxis response regulator CheB
MSKREGTNGRPDGNHSAERFSAPMSAHAADARADLVSPAANGGSHTGTAERLRIIIADPDPLARRVIRDSLRHDGGFIVAAEAKDGIEAVELALHYRPELLLMEVGMPALDGIGACREITAKAPQVRIVMFSVPQDRDVEIKALRAGAAASSPRTPISRRSRGRCARSRAARRRSAAR